MELLLVSHRGIASGMKSAIAMVMGPVAEQITAMELTEEEGVGNFSKRLEEYLVTWLSGTGKGLVFADLRGLQYGRACGSGAKRKGWDYVP